MCVLFVYFGEQRAKNAWNQKFFGGVVVINALFFIDNRTYMCYNVHDSIVEWDAQCDEAKENKITYIILKT